MSSRPQPGFKRTLYVSDLDGTLLSPDAVVSPVTEQLLAEAYSKGALFTVATARTPATVAYLLENVSLRVPAIVMTGAALWDKTASRYLNPRYIAPRQVELMSEIYTELRLSAFIYTLRDEKLHIYALGAITPAQREFMQEREGNPFKVFHPEGEKVPGNENVLMFFATGEPPKVDAVYSRLQELGGCNAVDYLDIYRENTAILEVFAPGVSKSSAMLALARECGAERIVAFGDNLNDIDMLRAADCGVAVANAAPAVLEAASVVIGSNSENAVARFILDDINHH